MVVRHCVDHVMMKRRRYGLKTQQYVSIDNSDAMDYAAQLCKDLDNTAVVTKELQGDGYWRRIDEGYPTAVNPC